MLLSPVLDKSENVINMSTFKIGFIDDVIWTAYKIKSDHSASFGDHYMKFESCGKDGNMSEEVLGKIQRLSREGFYRYIIKKIIFL